MSIIVLVARAAFVARAVVIVSAAVLVGIPAMVVAGAFEWARDRFRGGGK